MTRRAFAFFAASVLRAQERADIRTTVQLVVIPTSVKDDHNKPIDGLQESDFTVEVDGKIVPHHFEVEVQPISIAVAVETSANSGPALAKIVKAAPMIQPLISGERGEAALIQFGGDVTVVQQFDSGLNTELFRDMRARGYRTPIIDAVNQAAELLEARPKKRRRVILLISQTRDQGSAAKIDDVVARVQKDNISVYALTYSPFLTTFTVRRSEMLGRKADKEEKKEPAYQAGRGMDLTPLFRGLGNLGKIPTTKLLAEVTGGLDQGFVRHDKLEEIVQRASEDLHSQYLLTIQAPGPQDERFHALTVRCKAPKAIVRARSGYWSGLE